MVKVVNVTSFFNTRIERSIDEYPQERIESCPGNPEDRPALNVLTSGLLLCIPILVHWTSLAIFYQLTVPVFRLLSKRDRFLHILSNTWVTVPVRVPRHQVQVHKGHEQTMTIVLVTANLLLTAILSAFLIQPRSPWFPGLSEQLGLSWREESSCHQVVGGSEFLLFFGLPSLLCHLMGCAMLLIYYKTSHPWRELGQARERHCCGKLGDSGVPLQWETPYWEEEKEGNFSHSVGILQLHGSILETFRMQNITDEGSFGNDSTVDADEGETEGNENIAQEVGSVIQSSRSPPSSFSQSSWSADENVCRLQKLTELDVE